MDYAGVVFSHGEYLLSVVQDISMQEVNGGFLGKFELKEMLLWYKLQLALNQGEGRNMSQYIIH